MARKKKGLPIHGWVLIDKPLEMSSSQAVGKVRWLLKAQKAGHGGTLDPLATGLLPIALGEATKTISYALEGDKTYEFIVKWGSQTTTDDLEGDVLSTSDHRPTEAEILSVLPKFTGDISQIPPIFSAIKINGQRAYDLARKHDFLSGDAPFDMPKRNITIKRLILKSCQEDQAHFEVDCSKGTYVRSLARDIALSLKTTGHVILLRRLKVGPFDVSSAISLKGTDEELQQADIKNRIIPLNSILKDIPNLSLLPEDVPRLQQGQKISFRKSEHPSYQNALETIKEGQEILALYNGVAIGLCTIEKGSLKVVRNLNLL